MTYRSTAFGSCLGLITGAKYRLVPGRTIPAPPGDLYGQPGVEWAGSDPEPEPETPAPPVTMEVVMPKGARSADFTVRQVQNLAASMDRDQLAEFIAEDQRITVRRLLLK